MEVLIGTNWVNVTLGTKKIKYKFLSLEKISESAVNVYVALNNQPYTLEIGVFPGYLYCLSIAGVFIIENAKMQEVEIIE